MLLHYLAKLNMPFSPFSRYSCYKNMHRNSFICFNDCNLCYLTHITITCIWLNRHCLSYARSAASPLSTTRTICRLSSLNAPSLGVFNLNLLKWETPTLISSGLWLQHPDLNPVNYNIWADIQQKVYLKKFITCTDWHYGMFGIALSHSSAIT